MCYGRPRSESTYSSHSKISEYTSCDASHDASILDLGWPCVAVHPGQLELRIGAHSLGEGHISDHVSECLSKVDTLATVGIVEGASRPLRCLNRWGLTFPVHAVQTLSVWYDL